MNESYSFETNLSQLVNENNIVTQRGVQIASRLSSQLRALPVHCAIELSNQAMAERATAFAHHLYHVQRARPGQIGVGFVDDLNSDTVRFVIERYEQ